MQKFSLLIIVKNRRRHLENVLRAIPASSVRPDEVIVVHMNEDAYGIDPGYALREIICRSQEPLPLAKARNMAARTARHDRLVFLDVDCIPDPDCFRTLLQEFADWQLGMVDPRYLNNPVTDESIDFQALAADAHANPARQSVGYGRSDDYGMFWSLGFTISRQDFETIGGFDEGFVGYGGEDTDFALSAKQAGISLGFGRALVYHQNHGSYDPPLNWLADIVTNAKHYRQKWGEWPMDGWLRQFADLGYVSWNDDELRLLRKPTQAEIDARRQDSSY